VSTPTENGPPRPPTLTTDCAVVAVGSLLIDTVGSPNEFIRNSNRGLIVLIPIDAGPSLTDELAAFHPDAVCDFHECLMRHAQSLGEVRRGDSGQALSGTRIRLAAGLSEASCVIIGSEELVQYKPLRWRKASF